LNIFQDEHIELLRAIGQQADDLKSPSYVVGGYVRDRLLKRSFKKDIDIVCVGSGIELAKMVGKQFSVKVNYFKNFGTANLKIQGIEVEFVGARKESYQRE